MRAIVLIGLLCGSQVHADECAKERAAIERLSKPDGQRSPGVIAAQVRAHQDMLERCEKEQQRRQKEIADQAAAAAARKKSEQEQAARLELIKADNKQMRSVFGATLCALANMRKHATDEIATEKRYAAKGAGIVDQEKLYELQQDMRHADELIALVKSELRTYYKGLVPSGCNDRIVQGILNCYSSEECTDAQRDYTAFLADILQRQTSE